MDSTITAERNKMSEAEIARLYQEANRKALIKRRVERTALVAVNVVAAFVILLPLFYAVSIAFMPSSELFTTELNLFPSSPTLDNFKEAMRKGDAVLLEPIMKVTVTVPEQYMGDVIGDINSRRGRIEGMDDRNNVKVIHSYVPLAEMFGYSTDLRSRTQGRGNYTMEPHSYVEVPKNIAEKIISERTKNN